MAGFVTATSLLSWLRTADLYIKRGMSEEKPISVPNCLIRNLVLQPMVRMGTPNSVTSMRKGESSLLPYSVIDRQTFHKDLQGLCVITPQHCWLAADSMPCRNLLMGNDLSQRLPKSKYFERQPRRCRGHGHAKCCSSQCWTGQHGVRLCIFSMVQGSVFAPGETHASWWDTDTTVLKSACSAGESFWLNGWEIPR